MLFYSVFKRLIGKTGTCTCVLDACTCCICDELAAKGTCIVRAYDMCRFAYTCVRACAQYGERGGGGPKAAAHPPEEDH